MSLSLLLIAAFAAAQQPTPAAAPQRTVLHAGHVLDVRTGVAAADQAIIISGDRGRLRWTHQPAKPGDKEIDLRGMTVMPGLIDVHTHITMDTNFDPYHELTTTSIKEALYGVVNAGPILLAGFTSVRNVGASGYSDVALRDDINDGMFPGPHMQVAARHSASPADTATIICFPFEYTSPRTALPTASRPSSEGSPEHQVRRGPHQDLRHRRRSFQGRRSQASQYTIEEMKAIVADAHRLGRKVAAHAHGSQGAMWASEAGVDSIEHGSYIDEATIAVLKKNGTYLVPTAYLETSLLRPMATCLPSISRRPSPSAKSRFRTIAMQS